MVRPDTPRDPCSESLVAGDGLALALDVWNPRGRPCVLFAHGFGQTRQAWSGSAAALARDGFRCTSFDMRGHGESGRVTGGGYHMQQYFQDLAAVARAQPQPPVLVGASMGGLLGLAVAGEFDPVPFRALVLVDITPRWETAGVERILAFMRAHPDGFADYDAAAAAIADYLPHRRGRKNATRLEPLLRRGRDGRLRWHWDPAMLDTIVEESERYQPRLFDAARNVRLPVLLLSGALSDVVSGDTVDEFLHLVPHARHVALADATHMVAGDANDAFTREIADFLRGLPTLAADSDARFASRSTAHASTH